MKTFTINEWKELGEKLYDPNIEDWEVKCPMCGKLTKVIKFKEAGAEGPDCAFVECIGRYTGQGSPSESTGKGCNWAAYGLFGIPSDDHYRIKLIEDKYEDIFPFAKELEE